MSGKRPLKVGFFISARTGGMRGGQIRWNEIRQMAELSEQAGFDSFWLPDHLLFKEDDGEVHGPWEVWTLLSAIAAATSRVELGTLVLCTAFRSPTLLAKMAETLDEVSAGRLILGVGAGWHEPEYTAYGYPYDHRVGRFEEAITIIHTLLKEGKGEFHGDYYANEELLLRPRGPRAESGGIPILIGALANKPRMLGLCAKFADVWNGWLVPFQNTPETARELNAALDVACEAIGRDPKTLGRSVGVSLDQMPGSTRMAHGSAAQVHIGGSPEEIAEQLFQFAEAGIDHIQLMPTIVGIRAVEEAAKILEYLDK